MKRMALFTILAVLASSLLAAPANAQEKLEKGQDRIDVPAISEGLCLHPIFQSNMVLQRDKPIGVWGWAEPGEKVAVTFGNQEQSATAAADRSWKVELPAMPASSDPCKMTIKGKDKTIELENILVGDVWVLGGQSNMEFEIAKVDDGQLEIVSANFPQIRLMTIPQQDGPDQKKSFPRLYKWHGFFNRHFRQGDWDVCSPETVREMSAIGYVFGRRIHMATQVPIGLIDISRGGTCIETWLPMDVLKTVDTPEVKAKLAEWNTKVSEYDPQKDLEEQIKRYNDWVAKMEKDGKEIPADRKTPTDLRPGPAMDMNRPGNCYASMMAPISGLQVKGAIWHQGYNNAMQSNGHVMYDQLFPKMIEAWRAAFKNPEMAFGIISLCTDGEPQDLDNYLEKMRDEGIYIRAVQYQTFVELQKAGDKNIGFASSFDQRRAWYHPQIKIPVGERIACWALATQYGMSRDIRWEPPTCKEMTSEDGKLVLKMNSQVGPYNNGPILGFAIAGEDGKFQPAKAEYFVKSKDGQGKPQEDQSIIVLSSPLVPLPVYYRYAWGRNPLGNLRSAGIPLATQRSDNWNLADMYQLYTGKKTEVPNELSRGENGELAKVLKAEDMNRRLKEAEAFILEHAEKRAE